MPKEPALEEDHLAKTVAALERVAGHRPAGTRSSHSAKLLRQYGYIYRSEGSADQRPHYEFDEGGGNGLVNLPMHYVIDDGMYFNSRQPQLRVPRNAAAGLLLRPSIAARYVIG